jgi:hypothetical protein
MILRPLIRLLFKTNLTYGVSHKIVDRQVITLPVLEMWCIFYKSVFRFVYQYNSFKSGSDINNRDLFLKTITRTCSSMKKINIWETLATKGCDFLALFYFKQLHTGPWFSANTWSHLWCTIEDLISYFCTQCSFSWKYLSADFMF